MTNIRSQVLCEVRRLAYEEMKSIAFKHSGVIYGGFVRDVIISEHYSAIYNEDTPDKKHNASTVTPNINKFWNSAHMPETQDRCLLPSDMDVTFKTMEEADAFIHTVKGVRQYNNVNVNVKNISETHKYSPLISSIRKISIQILVGEIPFISYGSVVEISVDVVVPKPNITLQPPFGNLDMLCNGFIMTKDGGISFSQNTGTVIDHYSDAKRAMVVAGIIKDMLQFKTYLCFTTWCKTLDAKQLVNTCAVKRIHKMQYRRHKGWTLLNLPFKSGEYKQLQDSGDCAICSLEFEEGENYAYTITKTEDGTEIPCSKIHYGCFMQHLRYQMKSSELFTSQKCVFRCAFGNIIDFNLCQLDIEPACAAYMK
jgi:hypothetical protein